ncbi:hypothetical protein UFOVP685_50 [uncultured Caudovirales phage]|uniref:Uncharacterized protein n=1 Tax=uncultured Caudovirales phage TaxID=2100421 RepID=A0A6J5N7Q5_9CAUD|nr:hypothetical protein UFOVP590_34 [uncultured Caudovirales phage]CAB4157839.1 hypothetical protein UFOVP685_50 [uncultured Caudovirales phage]CAB5225295.1 hypothetical protein UFOVP750_2 [uncultured Caudovirales phage]
MSNYVVDHEELKALANKAGMLFDKLNEDLKMLRDENADIFESYMAYNRIRFVLKGIELALNISKSAMVSGHVLQNPLFHTEAGKKNGWDNPITFDHPFFMDKDEKDDDGEMPDFLKKILADAVLGVLVGRSSNDRNNSKE